MGSQGLGGGSEKGVGSSTMLPPNGRAAHAVEDSISAGSRRRSAAITGAVVEALCTAIVGASRAATCGLCGWLSFSGSIGRSWICRRLAAFSIYSLHSVDGSGAVRLLLT